MGWFLEASWRSSTTNLYRGRSYACNVKLKGVVPSVILTDHVWKLQSGMEGTPPDIISKTMEHVTHRLNK
jgi:hypothetical protein